MNPGAPGSQEVPSAGMGIEAEVESILNACAQAHLDERIAALTRVDEQLRAALDVEESK